ncbi:DUF6318 family protein [Arthrobacter castelli]|uniref:DUF6318 family protein n=1 Tax=Arthrobacter castelli TaxID=271431 RepID=UPI0004007F74|nr:DUF6318 family protein [Arthrobacter castelli]
MKNMMQMAAGAAVAALALTGCGTAASESQSESGHEVPVGASSAGPARNVDAPQESKPLTAKSAEGLKTFTYFWISYNSYAQQTGETDKLDELSSDKCNYCSNEIDMINKVYDDGGWMAGGDPRVTDIFPKLPEGKSTGTALVTYSETAGTIFNSEGEEASTIEPKKPTVLTVKASYIDGEWTMRSIEETPDAELPAT